MKNKNKIQKLKISSINPISPISPISPIGLMGPISPAIRYSLFAIPFLILYSLFFIPVAHAEEQMIPYARISYRPDGGVSITHFLASACQNRETMATCMDRIMEKNEMLKDLPYDDVPRNQLPTDRSERDKWVGEKGKGISIDKSKVTKAEKITELRDKLDEELAKSSPSSVKVAKLERLIEKVQDYKSSSNLIKPQDLADFDEQKQSLLASVVETLGSAISSAFDGILSSIQNGFLAIKNLVVGTPEAPSGITIYDQTTKQPYCLVMKDGQMQSVAGACPTNSESGIVNSELGESMALTPEADTVPPVITLNGPALIEIEKGTAWTDPGATVADPSTGSGQVNTNLSIYYKLNGVLTGNEGREVVQIDINTVADNMITYFSTDSAGNIGEAVRTVKVILPPTAPVEPTGTTTPIE